MAFMAMINWLNKTYSIDELGILFTSLFVCRLGCFLFEQIYKKVVLLVVHASEMKDEEK